MISNPAHPPAGVRQQDKPQRWAEERSERSDIKLAFAGAGATMKEHLFSESNIATPYKGPSPRSLAPAIAFVRPTHVSPKPPQPARIRPHPTPQPIHPAVVIETKVRQTPEDEISSVLERVRDSIRRIECHTQDPIPPRPQIVTRSPPTRPPSSSFGMSAPPILGTAAKPPAPTDVESKDDEEPKRELFRTSTSTKKSINPTSPSLRKLQAPQQPQEYGVQASTPSPKRSPWRGMAPGLRPPPHLN